MTHSKRWIMLVMVAALPLVGCGEAPAEQGHTAPATVEPTQDPAIKRIRLTEQAAERLGIQVREVTAAGQLLEAPYSAVFYGASGGASGSTSARSPWSSSVPASRSSASKGTRCTCRRDWMLAPIYDETMEARPPRATVSKLYFVNYPQAVATKTRGYRL